MSLLKAYMVRVMFARVCLTPLPHPAASDPLWDLHVCTSDCSALFCLVAVSLSKYSAWGALRIALSVAVPISVCTGD